jgi:hypothetical protein
MPDADRATTEILTNTPRTPAVRGSITSADGMTVESNFETADELRLQLEDETGLATVDVSEPEPEAPARPAPAPRKRNRREDPRIAVESAIGKQREAERLHAEAQDKLDALTAEFEAYKQRPPAPPAAPPSVPQGAPPMPPAAATPAPPAAHERYMAMPDAPKAEQFKSLDAYNYAVNYFLFTKMGEDVALQQREQQAEATFHQRLTTFKTATPDFDTRFNPNTLIDSRIWPYLRSLENAGAVLLYLSEHQDVAQRLTTLHPIDQVGQLGAISGTLHTQSAPLSAAAAAPPASARPPASSSAKPVTKRVTGAPPAAGDEPPGDDASDEAYEAYWGPRRRDARAAMRRHR